MPTNQRTLAKTEPRREAWTLGDKFGLMEDGGWVDALRHEWEKSPPPVRERWERVIALAREARPRSGKDWLSSEDRAELQCGHPPMDYPGEEAKPAPGSPAYQQELVLAAPDESWLTQIRPLVEADDFAPQLARIISQAMRSGVGSLNRNAPGKEILRAVIWCAATTENADCIDALRQLATWSVEHKTAQAKTIGIALAFLDSELTAGALRMIAEAAKRPSPKTRFNRYASHVETKIGLDAQDSAERFVPTFELDGTGVRRVACGEDGAIELRIEGSDVVLKYFNSSGKQVATPPAAVRRSHAELIESFRHAGRALGKLLATQRSRLESLFVLQTTWSCETWCERYLKHPVVGSLARRLIWDVGGNAVLFRGEQALDPSGRSVVLKPGSQVKLWHPINRTVEETVAWRDRLESLQITQPFKQAQREVYQLTDAERQTRVYSNRFAAHILNQSQFRALALARGWQRPFIGDWDGIDGKATRGFPGAWKVEFWMNGVGVEHGPTGALLYISTDQVRFHHEANAEPMPLDQVPQLIFSEAMRDVELFVSVASMGNDPTWADGGPEGRHRDYWQNYSFGELNASAKTRREVLLRLVPKLKIAKLCSFDDRFLVVKGALRTYRIHLGSGNIQMEPNNQYLCIVPKQGETSDNSVLLPFEGDRTLSVIISKAFLLADDAKIKDPSIVSQIKRT